MENLYFGLNPGLFWKKQHLIKTLIRAYYDLIMTLFFLKSQHGLISMLFSRGGVCNL